MIILSQLIFQNSIKIFITKHTVPKTKLAVFTTKRDLFIDDDHVVDLILFVSKLH